MLEIERPIGKQEVTRLERPAVKMLPTEWIEQNISIEGRPVHMDWRPWWHLPINMPYLNFKGMPPRREIVIVAGRQVEKSSSLANAHLADAATQPWLKILYVVPVDNLLSEFSFRRIDEIVSTSPPLQRLVTPSWNVHRKHFANHAQINLRVAYLSARQARGNPADQLTLDEVQEMLTDHLPVIRECLAHCEIPRGPVFRMIGTPKTFDNPLEAYWAQQSTQNEWMVRCGGGHWNILADKSIGPKGLICSTCGKPLNPFGEIDHKGRRRGAEWVRHGPATAPLEGFRVPQLLLPYTMAYSQELFEQKWRELLYKFKYYDRPKFFNEVLGISYDSGIKPITREELRAICMPGHHMLDLWLPEIVAPAELVNGHVFAGLDWGTGNPSKTVLVLGRYRQDNVFEIFYARRFVGPEAMEPNEYVKEIISLLKRNRVTIVGADRGFGFGLNSQLMTELGPEKVLVYQHTNQRAKLDYSASSNSYTVSRTQVLTDVFQLIKKRGLSFRFSWDELLNEGFAADFLSVHKEESKVQGLIYDHPPGTTDDTLHAACYAFLASQVLYPRPDLN